MSGNFLGSPRFGSISPPEKENLVPVAVRESQHAASNVRNDLPPVHDQLVTVDV